MEAYGENWQSRAPLDFLDAMENPFAFPEDLRAGLAAAIAGAALNRYPSAEAAA